MADEQSTQKVELTGHFVGYGSRGDVIELPSEQAEGMISQEFAIAVADDDEREVHDEAAEIESRLAAPSASPLPAPPGENDGADQHV